MRYYWILSSNPCQQCLTLSTQYHAHKPQRPHKMCKCTFVGVSEGQGLVCRPGIEIIGISLVNIETDYDAMDTDLSDKHLHHEYLVTGSCREGSIIDVNVVVEVSGQELSDRTADLEKEWESGGTGEKTSNELLLHTESLATQQALTQLRNLCPDCKLS